MSSRLRGPSKDVNFYLFWRGTLNVGRSYKDFSFVLQLAWIEPSSAGILVRTGSLSWFLVFPVSSQDAAIWTKLLMVFYPVWTQFQYKPEIKLRQWKTKQKNCWIKNWLCKKSVISVKKKSVKVYFVIYFNRRSVERKNAVRKARDLSSISYSVAV